MRSAISWWCAGRKTCSLLGSPCSAVFKLSSLPHLFKAQLGCLFLPVNRCCFEIFCEGGSEKRRNWCETQWEQPRAALCVCTMLGITLALLGTGYKARRAWGGLLFCLSDGARGAFGAPRSHDARRRASCSAPVLARST